MALDVRREILGSAGWKGETSFSWLSSNFPEHTLARTLSQQINSNLFFFFLKKEGKQAGRLEVMPLRTRGSLVSSEGRLEL